MQRLEWLKQTRALKIGYLGSYSIVEKRRPMFPKCHRGAKPTAPKSLRGVGFFVVGSKGDPRVEASSVASEALTLMEKPACRSGAPVWSQREPQLKRRRGATPALSGPL